MDYKKQLEDVRVKIDEIDNQMMQLFKDRMEIIDKVADIKSQANISIVDEKREDAIVEARTNGLSNIEKGEAALFIRSMMGASKIRQRRYLYGEKIVSDSLLPNPRKPVTQDVKVGYQGVEGAWTEVASMKAIPNATYTPYEEWEDVFCAVKDKKINYGVLPVENSQTGAIGEVYDLLRKYGCYIVGETAVEIKHCLIGTKDATIEDIREVYSHAQGFSQCTQFLRKKGWELTVSRNTAMAAKKVSELNEKRYAAIGSKRAAEINGLKILEENISNTTLNKTRFIIIADLPEYDESADTVSVILRTAHRSGALVDALFPFVSENINLSRLESRPVADGKYCFFTDIQGNIKDEKIIRALNQADGTCGFLEVLGCYKANK